MRTEPAAFASESGGFETTLERVLSSFGPCHLFDVRGSGTALLVHGLRQRTSRPLVYVVKDASTQADALDDLSACAGQHLGLPVTLERGRRARTTSYDLSDGTAYDETMLDRRREMARVAALYLFLAGHRDTLVIPARALVRKCVPFSVLSAHATQFALGQNVELERSAAFLVGAGYLRTPLVEEPGELAIRGGLLDLWPAGSPRPLRLELDGDKLVRLSEFSPDTQKSKHEVTHVVVPPAREALLTSASKERAQHMVQALCDAVDYPTLKARALIEDVTSGRVFFGSEAFLPAYAGLVPLLELLTPDTLIVLEDPAAIVANIRKARTLSEAAEERCRDRPHFVRSELYSDDLELVPRLLAHALLITHPTSTEHLGPTGAELEALEVAPATTESLGSEDHQDLRLALDRAQRERGSDAFLDPLSAALKTWSDALYRVTLVARTHTQADRLETLLGHRGFVFRAKEAGASAAASAPDQNLSIEVAPLARGVVLPSAALVLLTEEEIFGKRRHRSKRKSQRNAVSLDDLSTLQLDDYVVHLEHGIGRYKGLCHKRVGDIWIDLIEVEYQGGDKLFLPVYRLNQIQRHASSETGHKLDRLGGQTFARTKAKVRRRVREMADELLRLYAERLARRREPVPVPGDDYQTFEAQFPFEETPDQAAAILDVVGDLGRDVVMDRLVCGDVGFGKTEVALRAAFLAAMDGRQVALLCPTTVLAQQHFLTFQTRFRQYPVSVAALSRFQSKKRVTETLIGTKAGQVDIVVGTHRVLSKDVHFKNLGLLIVDEEQRFGVAHKERIKQLKQSVDVLTLSATPIPRTLQMAISGLRDLSMISTPPVDRRRIRTIVARVDDSVIKSAIERELQRGGQVFYVYNRVEGLEARAERIEALLPGVRVAVAHGQQSERELERVMLAFIAGAYDVLVSTAIIENGLDIPRANTMLVDRADLFGLSQLYQLRGRVGRSSQQAFCYLMVPPRSRMSDVANARIDAMQRYTELGSGFQIANMDMELRGTGDLLGAEQSGFVQSVGFELFCQMLREVTAEIDDQAPKPGIDPDLSFDVEALIPEDYVDDIGLRLGIYKRLASAESSHDVEAIASEFADRFGPPPGAVRRLVALMHLKVELRELCALSCEASKERVTLHLDATTPLSAARVSALLAENPGRYSLSPTGKLTRRALANEQYASGLQHTERFLRELGSRANVT